MNPGINLIKERKDLTQYLFHFTKGKNPSQTLVKILDERKLTSSLGYICFTETPITQFKVNLEYMNNFERPMFSNYGIAFKRDILINNHGAKPVIYGDEEDYKKLKEIEMDWRFELLNTEYHDFTWLREWRIKDFLDFSKVNPNDIIIIAPNQEELNQICKEIDLIDIDFSYEHEIRSCVPYPIYAEVRNYKGISIKDLDTIVSDTEISKITDKQKIGEQL